MSTHRAHRAQYKATNSFAVFVGYSRLRQTYFSVELN
ncbi:Uncharacterised protein [Vibrio cholerae]|nr:Uncharacterised protein [Vibrio cholerae]